MTLIHPADIDVLERQGSFLSAKRHKSVSWFVRKTQPQIPVYCLRPHSFAAQARRFLNGFSGDVLYAVKCNPDICVLETLFHAGITHFDVASLGEIKAVHDLLPKAELHFMHPVKSRQAIREAYRFYGVRDFAFDSHDELCKILQECDQAKDLGLVLRVAVPKGTSLWDLSGKFGASIEESVALLRQARPVAHKLGVSFHVGSQCMDPHLYDTAIEFAAGIVATAGVEIDIFDVGGGFPVAYQDLTPPPLEKFLEVIRAKIEQIGLPSSCRIWCEPGRALVAAGGSLVARVELRRGHDLYINDGVYGSLSDAGPPGFRFPVRMIRSSSAEKAAFRLFGPTCDSADRMEGPFFLPDDIHEGDWIEIGQLGAYSRSLATDFNGFSPVERLLVEDAPLIE